MHRHGHRARVGAHRRALRRGPLLRPGGHPDVLKVHFSNNKSNPGPSIDVDRFEKAPKADIALLHLETPKKLKKYSKVADGHRNGDWIRDTAGVSTRPKRIEPQTESVWGSYLVELPGIEPGSFVTSPGLLRAQFAQDLYSALRLGQTRSG